MAICTPTPLLGASDPTSPSLPEPIGPLTDVTVAMLRDPHRRLRIDDILGVESAVPLIDRDFQLALYCIHELHYRGFADAHCDAEWHPHVVEWWHLLGERFEAALVDRVSVPTGGSGTAGDAIADAAEVAAGPSLSQFVLDHADASILREFAIQRSAYQRKEADPHTFALPRLGGPAKAAFVEIQMDEYGNGVPGRAHAELFAASMAWLGLDPTYGAYLHRLPASTLATVNLMSHLALHRRLLPALLGHLALFEMTSVVPMGRYAQAMRRIGAPDEACAFYDVHVVADEHHGPLAQRGMVDAYVGGHRGDASLVVWGAQITMALEQGFAEHLVGAWTRGDSSLVDESAVVCV